MNEKMRGTPPIGIYAGKVQSNIVLEQKTNKDGNKYEAGTVEIDVVGGRGPVSVKGRYETTLVKRHEVEFFRGLKEGDVFIFQVGPTKNNFTGFTMMASKAELLEAMEGHIVARGELMGTYER